MHEATKDYCELPHLSRLCASFANAVILLVDIASTCPPPPVPTFSVFAPALVYP